MNLTEKYELADTCVYFNNRRAVTGNCCVQGYAPFDCPSCTSYIDISASGSAASGREAHHDENCKLCGAKMVWENPYIPGYFQASSCYIEGWPICHECMVEHCCHTDCSSCGYGKAPDCQFLWLKRHYMGED